MYYGLAFVLGWWLGNCTGWKLRGWLDYVDNDSDVMP